MLEVGQIVVMKDAKGRDAAPTKIVRIHRCSNGGPFFYVRKAPGAKTFMCCPADIRELSSIEKEGPNNA